MDMPLTPADVRNKQFSRTRLRPGYDEEEVDAFLDEVEAELDRLIQENEELRAKLAEVLRGGKMATPLNSPHMDSPDHMQQESLRIEPERRPEPMSMMKSSEDNMDTAARVLALAQQTADQAIADARREADETLSRARREADDVLTKARRQSEQVMSDARARAASLERAARPPVAGAVPRLGLASRAELERGPVRHRHSPVDRARSNRAAGGGFRRRQPVACRRVHRGRGAWRAVVAGCRPDVASRGLCRTEGSLHFSGAVGQPGSCRG